MTMKRRWRLYCETEAAEVYEWKATGVAAPTVCPNDPGHTIDSSSVVGVAKKDMIEILFRTAPFDTSAGDYPLTEIPDNTQTRFSFYIPDDFKTLLSLTMRCLSPSLITGDGTIKLYSDYGLYWDPPTQNSESNTNLTFGGPANRWFGVNISSVYSSLAARHICGLKLETVNLGFSLQTIGILLNYERE